MKITYVAFLVVTTAAALMIALVATAAEATPSPTPPRFIRSSVSGRSLKHVRVDDAEARRRMIATGMPEGYAELLVGLDAAIRAGAEDRVTDTVERVTGRPPRSLETFSRALAEAFRGA